MVSYPLHRSYSSTRTTTVLWRARAFFYLEDRERTLETPAVTDSEPTPKAVKQPTAIRIHRSRWLRRGRGGEVIDSRRAWPSAFE